jgi:ABC-type branched-subunit amino acid transport system ATPase component
MSNQLILPSLEIRQFRIFSKLEIERLGRVNLIVGKNNVGKTSVLEAIYLYANPADPQVLLDLISSRDEFDRPGVHATNGRRATPVPVPVAAIFHGRSAIPEQTPAISVGPMDADSKTLHIRSTIKRPGRKTSGPVAVLDADEESGDDFLEGVPALSYGFGRQPPLLLPINDSWRFSRYSRVSNPKIDALTIQTVNSCYVESNNSDPEWVKSSWNKINLTSYHDEITNSLRIIDDKVQQVSANLNSNDELVPIVRLEGSTEPITLRSMGDGMVRMFKMALALVNSRGGFLLVDEVENGLHYSVHADFWTFLIKLAQVLDVQVFATTHSWDCVEGFQKAASEDSLSDGYLIRLARRKDEIVATVYDENDLTIVTRDQIEVR